MPIHADRKRLYPFDWPQLSASVRFVRAVGRCEVCRRPHGMEIECTPDGRWLDGEMWRNGSGRPAGFPKVATRTTRVFLAAAHLDHDPTHNSGRNLKALCQRCHLIHDRPEHLRRRRITYGLRRAIGDLFTGPYPT